MNAPQPKLPEPGVDFETVEFMQKDAPDVRFEGKLIGILDSRTVDTRQKSRDSDRYTRLELYELRSGKWVAARVACSDRQGEVDIATVAVIPVDNISVEFPNIGWGVEPETVEGRYRELAVMSAFGWTWLAKEFAGNMGWEHVQELV